MLFECLLLGSHTGDYAQNVLWLRLFFTNDYITAKLQVEDYYISSDFCIKGTSARKMWPSSLTYFYNFTLRFYFISEVNWSYNTSNLALSRFPLPSSFKEVEAVLYWRMVQYGCTRSSWCVWQQDTKKKPQGYWLSLNMACQMPQSMFIYVCLQILLINTVASLLYTPNVSSCLISN